MSDWDDAIKEAYAAAPADQVLWSTLEINHSTMVAPVRMINDHGEYQETLEPSGIDIYGRILRLEADAPENPDEDVLFQAVGFKFQLAEQSDARISGMEIEIDNATKIISSYLDEAVTVRSPLTVIYREYISMDVTIPKLVIRNLTIPRVTSNTLSVVATAEFRDLVNKKFPNKLYRPDEYRGLLSQ